MVKFPKSIIGLVSAGLLTAGAILFLREATSKGLGKTFLETGRGIGRGAGEFGYGIGNIGKGIGVAGENIGSGFSGLFKGFNLFNT